MVLSAADDDEEEEEEELRPREVIFEKLGFLIAGPVDGIVLRLCCSTRICDTTTPAGGAKWFQLLKFQLKLVLNASNYLYHATRPPVDLAPKVRVFN